MAKTEYVETTVKVKVTVEVVANNYDARDWKLKDIVEQAGREARSRVSNLLNGNVNVLVVGEPEVMVVMSKLLR